MDLRKPPKSITGSLAVLAAATAVATVAAAPDSRPPRIVAAAMQDADRDGRADRLLLTYSERVQHRADRDGRYPFQVGGYTIQSVERASGRTILLTLVEQAAAAGVGFRDDVFAALETLRADHSRLRRAALEHAPSGELMCHGYTALFQRLLAASEIA